MNEMNQATTPKKTSKSMLLPIILVTGGILAALLLFRSQSNNDAQTELPAATSVPEVIDNSEIETSQTSPQLIDGEELPLITETTNEQVRTIAIEAGSFYYQPNLIRVKKGETIRIEMTSADAMHNFNIDELDVQIPLTQSGTTGTVEFTADTVGEFEFYCSVGQHRANGQVGTLIVEE